MFYAVSTIAVKVRKITLCQNYCILSHGCAG